MSWTTIIAVSWSSTWLSVAMLPSFISTLILPPPLPDMRCASSPTVIVSGPAFSRTTGWVGCATAFSPVLGADPPRWRPPPRPCQPPTPPPMSPRVLMVRRRTESSRRMVVCLTFFAFFSAFGSPAFGACSVPVAAAPAAAAAAGGGGAARSTCLCSASRRSRSCFSRSSVAWISESCCWRLCSCSRSSSSLGSGPAGAGAAGGGGGGGAGISAAVAAAASSEGSRLTKTRFLRTSTWMVRALPIESDFLISLVCLRVSVILFFGSIEPCDLRRYSSRRALSCSLSESSATGFSTPAARNCSSRTEGGTFNSLANWATLVWATLMGFLLRHGGLRLFGEPVGARRHDEGLRLFGVHSGHLRQLVHREVRQIVARLHALRGELGGELRIHALQLQQLRGDAVDALFARDRLHQQRVARAAAQLVHGVLVERVDLEHFVDRHVGHFLERREALLDQDVGHFLVHVEPLHEQLLGARALFLLLLGGLFLGHQVDGPAGELGGEPHVLPAAADGDGEVLLVHHHVHGVLLLVDQDRAHLGRRQRADHEGRRVGRPEHDVDALAGQLLGHGLHARAAHADARADRVDAPVVGVHRDLGAHAA